MEEGGLQISLTAQTVVADDRIVPVNQAATLVEALFTTTEK
jgi:hypothetical protein